MFDFAKSVFGRKAPSQTGSSSPNPWASPPASSGRGSVWSNRDVASETSTGPTVETIRAVLNSQAHSANHNRSYLAVRDLSTKDRTHLLLSLGQIAQQDPVLFNDYNSLPYSCWESCLRFELDLSPEDLPVLLLFLCKRNDLRSDYLSDVFKTLMRHINKAISDGGFLTGRDSENLATLAGELRTLSEAKKDKVKKKLLLNKAETIEKLAGIDVSVTSLLLARCEGAENPLALGEKPEHYDFWIKILGETIAGLHAIVGDFAKSKTPIWMKDALAFAQTFPSLGPVTPRFGAWKEAKHEPYQDLSHLKAYTKKRHKTQCDLADPQRVFDLSQLRQRYVSSFDIVWNTDQIPALEVLADLETPAWTALVEHLISGKVAPRPTSAWLKTAVKLAQDVGTQEVADRLAKWLELFYRPAMSKQSLGDRTNVEQMDYTVALLNERLPTWPAQLQGVDIATLGRSLAIMVASGTIDNPFYFDDAPHLVMGHSLIEYGDHGYEGKFHTHGVLRITGLPRLKASNNGYGARGPLGWLQVSIENEALLRGALWLASEIMPAETAVLILESVAISAAQKLTWGDQGHRSKVVANAAIATLIDKDGPHGHAAMLRLTRSIDNRSISGPLLKALNS